VGRFSSGDTFLCAEGWRKGRLFEDLVEHYFQLRGYETKRNVRMRGGSGAIHEVDILLVAPEGYSIVEAKNTSEPIPKEVIMKAFEVARDVGARGAVVVSASGFTPDAQRVARSLGVELLTLDDILNYLESSETLRASILLEPRVSIEKLDSEARRKASWVIPLFKRERVSRLGCIYAPVYYVEATVRLEGSRMMYKDLDLVASGVTGLPLFKRRSLLLEGGARAAGLPTEYAETYRILAGRIVKRGDALKSLGKMWRGLEASLEAAGLLEIVSERPKTYRVLDDRPPLEDVEEAASLMLAPKASSPGGCLVIEPRYSPGSAVSVLERLYGLIARRASTIYVPLAVYRLSGRGGLYRFLLLTIWTKKPLELRPVDPGPYVIHLLQANSSNL
jgi:hypothetical protein